ncbi:hypothetical protein M3603_15440 [Rummeliibacillus stabekisii]|uniref:hypothetical protein n=1 Tax=Rummeliibacillus stabekisii TaxID=241244 RepID=UPI00203B6F21|nr:hypothetical protein [Rummeliibacillus stabekisii]MCM3318011.1 hypothetical protein [Rummeliibacillus stabekisii]
MNIFLLTPTVEGNRMWENTLQIAAPISASTTCLTTHNWLNEIRDNNLKSVPTLLIIVNSHSLLNDEAALQFIKEHNIPVICIDGDLQKVDSAELYNKGVKALANKHISIEKMSEIIRIVTNGGIYIETEKEERGAIFE